VLSDMRDFVREDSFDLAVSMFTSFGYFDRKEDDLTVLRNIYRSLKAGGVCLIDVVGKEWLAGVFQPVGCEEMADGTLLIQRREIFDNWTRIRNEWIMIRDGRASAFKFHHTVYSGQELLDRLERAGFNQTRLFGGLDGREYNREASRLVAVGWK